MRGGEGREVMIEEKRGNTHRDEASALEQTRAQDRRHHSICTKFGGGTFATASHLPFFSQ